MSIKVYTDGACKGNPGVGGWGVYIKTPDYEKDLYGGNPETTNNQMEMQAALEALKYLRDKTELVELYTDSNYLRQGITEWIHNWKKITGELLQKSQLLIENYGFKYQI